MYLGQLGDDKKITTKTDFPSTVSLPGTPRINVCAVQCMTAHSSHKLCIIRSDPQLHWNIIMCTAPCSADTGHDAIAHTSTHVCTELGIWQPEMWTHKAIPVCNSTELGLYACTVNHVMQDRKILIPIQDAPWQFGLLVRMPQCCFRGLLTCCIFLKMHNLNTLYVLRNDSIISIWYEIHSRQKQRSKLPANIFILNVAVGVYLTHVFAWYWSLKIMPIFKSFFNKPKWAGNEEQAENTFMYMLCLKIQ